MKDVFVAVIIIWVLWRIFGGRTIIHRYNFTQHQNNNFDQRKEGEVKVEKDFTKKPDKLNDQAGEYVDYEELK